MAEIIHEPSFPQEVITLIQAAEQERKDRQRQLPESTKLKELEADLSDQLNQLALQGYARAARWQAHKFSTQADDLAQRRKDRRSRADSRKLAEDLEKKLADLPDDPIFDLNRDFYRSNIEVLRHLASDRELVIITRSIQRREAAFYRKMNSQALHTARRMKRRRVLFRFMRVGRWVVAFVIGFGLFSYGIEQLRAGIPVNGAVAIAIAAGIFLLVKPVEKRATEYQKKIYRRWLSNFINSVSQVRWETELAILTDRYMKLVGEPIIAASQGETQQSPE
jgi:hypothetical protein